jgi:predicted dehydrogenase
MSTRREVLSLAAAPLVRAAYGQARDRKLKLGLIGAGWYGMVDLEAAFRASNVEAAAICDVDTAHLKESAEKIVKLQGSEPKQFKDYRELIAMPGLDAVILATPPQWHALQFIDLCRKGLACYCEKPLAYDIREGRAMVNAWQKAGNIVQVGFQRRQPNGFSEAREFVRSGQAGRIVQIDAQIHYNASPEKYTPQDPPATLDWNTWCGPAPKLGYSPNIAHKAWRLEKEFGNGHLVDWGIHLIDAIRVMMDLGAPKSVVSAGGIYEYKGRITTPDTLTTHFEFEQLPVVWRHRLWGAAENDPATANGVFLYGDKATVFASDGGWAVLPRGGKPEDRKTMKASGGDSQTRHVAEFLDAVRGGKQPSCTPQDAYQSAVTVQLGMISYYTGSRVDWDAKTEQIAANPRAARLLKRDYRAPYKHPYSA